MLAILIDHVERSQVQENESKYLQLTFEMLKAGELAMIAQEECLRAFKGLV